MRDYACAYAWSFDFLLHDLKQGVAGCSFNATSYFPHVRVFCLFLMCPSYPCLIGAVTTVVWQDANSKRLPWISRINSLSVWLDIYSKSHGPNEFPELRKIRLDFFKPNAAWCIDFCFPNTGTWKNGKLAKWKTWKIGKLGNKNLYTMPRSALKNLGNFFEGLGIY